MQPAAQESCSTTLHMAQCADDQNVRVRTVHEVQTHVADTAATSGHKRDISEGWSAAGPELRVTPAPMANQDMDRFSSFAQSHYPRKAAEHVLGKSLAPVGVDQDEDDSGVGTCLPGFRRVQRRWGWNGEWGEMLSPPRLLRLENARSEMACRASAALCYSTELIKSQGGLARESLCSVFRRAKSADELDQEKLMELFLHAVEVGSVKISRQEDEPSFQ